MELTDACKRLLHGLIGDSGAELIIDDTEVYIDISAVGDGVIPLDSDAIRTLLTDLAVALRFADSL